MKAVTIIAFLWSLCLYAQAHEYHHPNELIKKLQTQKKPEINIYKIYCANCHNKDPLIELNAPKFRHTTDWQERLKQNKSDLFKNVNEGLNAMPARGGCFECSDALLKKTIEYMLPNIAKPSDIVPS